VKTAWTWMLMLPLPHDDVTFI